VLKLLKIDHVCLNVADPRAAAARYAVQFGLEVREQGDDRATLACDYEPYSLELVRGEPLGEAHTAWQLRRSCSLDDARAHLAAAAGADWDDEGDTLVVRDPEGFEHHIVAYRDDGDGRPAIARQTSSLAGLRPRKLGHVNRLTADLAATTRFHTDVLGMEIADYLGDAGIWFHVNAEHHQMALVQGSAPHFHHLAFDYYDFGTLRSLFDNVAQHGRWLAWGPLRHGIAQNICGYVRITEEPLLVECYVDMEQLEPDHEPRHWPDDRFSSNTWGPLPPRSYFRFDAEAVRYERDSLEMLGEKLPPLEVHT
jgi:catechol 2,3-dioxygenase-like lactoylglutathione lyase family enzyme